MRPFFQPRLLNDPFGDPCLRVDLVGLSASLLFDLGWVPPPGPGRLGPISHVFVSHTHVDHFIGFDPLIRSLLPRPKLLRIYGPEGIIRNVEGKFRGYTWNLVEEYPLEVEVRDISTTHIRSERFTCGKGLKGETGEVCLFDGTVCKEGHFIVEAVHLDHLVPCLAFVLREPFHININKEKLHRMGLETGSWLRTLRRLVYEAVSGDTVVSITKYTRRGERARQYTLEELREEVLTLTRGHRIAYVVDCIYSEDNREKIKTLASDADVMFCEASFLHADMDRAWASGHLTARQAGLLAREAGARKLKVFHFSKRYEGCGSKLQREAMEAFAGG